MKPLKPDLGRVRIVLVEPRGPFNIGSVARFMKNVGSHDLALVSPAAFHNDEAYRACVGARDILDGAAVFRSLEDAVRSIHLVAGTTRRSGKDRRLFCSLEELPERLLPVLEHGRAAILFGREESGLMNRETDLCHILVDIPTTEGFPSINLSHAVALVLYRLYIDSGAYQSRAPQRPVPQEKLEELLRYVQSTFSEIGFFSKGPPDYVIPLFRKVFGRALLDEEELVSLTRIFHRLYGLCKEWRERAGQAPVGGGEGV